MAFLTPMTNWTWSGPLIFRALHRRRLKIIEVERLDFRLDVEAEHFRREPIDQFG
jgi:hypothetical protein